MAPSARDPLSWDRGPEQAAPGLSLEGQIRVGHTDGQGWRKRIIPSAVRSAFKGTEACKYHIFFCRCKQCSEFLKQGTGS